jgi:chromatin segregation and condensation protein Rec8/ScpA/Scc1 (kleisin family)
MSTENTKSLMFEMRVMNDIRKLTPEQRKEMMNTIQTEEQLEEEALKKNPNLHLERNLQLVLGELKEMRNEVKNIKAHIEKDKYKIWEPTVNILDTVNDDYEECAYSDWLPFIIFVLFVLFSFLGKSS